MKNQKDINEAVEAARETFRKLAVFEIDPKKSLAAHSAWDNGSRLIECADVVDEIYWHQILPDGDYQSLIEQIGDDDELREMLFFYHGPYDQFNNNVPFLSVPPQPPGAEFYPRDLTRDEFAAYIRDHQDLKTAFESPYTVITRANSHLAAVPYHAAHERLVGRLADLLTEASTVEQHGGFREFLSQRARDIKLDDYYVSESLWIRLEDNPLDMAIGPYEVYDDQLMGLKAAYEAILFERDLEESARISHAQRELSSLCKLLERDLGSSLSSEDTSVKLSVANLVYASGDARKAVPAFAFSLPNDEQIIEEVGSRQVILKNVLEAKFNLVAHRIANRLLQEPIEEQKTAFRNFFDHTLFHEISHSIGPKRIAIGNEETTVNRCLKQYHSVLEEAKADALGACFALTAVSDLDPALFLRGYIGRFIRSIRFGIAEAHGGANAIQFNYLLQEGGFQVDDATKKILVNQSRAREAVFKLASEIIKIQEHGDFNAAQNFAARFCIISPEIQALVSSVLDIPVDIRIRYRDCP